MPAFGGDALSWREAEGHRFAALEIGAPSRDVAGFCFMEPASMGIRFTNSLAFDKLLNNHNLLNGSGVAAGDYDGDGWVDLFFAGVGGKSGLFRNLGNWKFEDATASAGVACAGMAATGAAFVDADGDGALDLFVTSCGGPNSFFRNLGNGRFTNLTEVVGFGAKLGGTSMAFGDVDRDGDLEVYVANYGENTIRSGMPFSTRMVGGREVVTGRNANRLKIMNGKLVEFGEPDFLGQNDGTGKLTALTFTGGTFLDATGQPLKQALWDLGLSAMFRDINGDGAPDLYVCNDFQTPDRIWINNGAGKLRAASAEMLPYTSWFSMAVDFADINRDGLVDFFVADMDQRSRAERMRKAPPEGSPIPEGEFETRPQFRRNTLGLNRGDGTFAEIAELAGLSATEWTWSAVFLDVDLDGYEDLLIGNGHAYDTEDQDTVAKLAELKLTRAQSKTNIFAFPMLTPPNMVFRNNRDLTFAEMGASWGFNATNVCHGMCLADLDNDGDQDVILNAFQTAPLLYRNETMAARVAVRLKGAGKNTRGIGAKIEVKAAKLTQSQEMIAGGRYLSSDDPMRTFAFFEGATIEVTWPSGKRSVVKDVKANHVYEVHEAGAVAVAEKKAESKETWFVAATGAAQAEGEKKLAEAGKISGGSFVFEAGKVKPGKWPVAEASKILANGNVAQTLADVGIVNGAAFGDLNGDGAVDLVLACAWGRLRVFLNKDGKFEEATERMGLEKFSGIWNGVAVGDFDRDGKLDFVASNLGRNHRWQKHRPAPARIYYGDFDGNDSVETIEALVENGKACPMAVMQRVGMALPGLGERVKSARKFAEMSMEEILGEEAKRAKFVEAGWFESTVFLNRGDRFEARAMPAEAQFAPGFGLAAADFDGDGALDIFMAQNDSQSSIDSAPIVAGRGALLMGDGKGNFRAAALKESGISIRGDQRACAAGDFDGDGRVDLAVAVMGGPARVYKNARAREGQ